MSTMTKKTTVTYNAMLLGANPANIMRVEKLNEMFNAGKTDGYSESLYKLQCDGTADNVLSLVGYRFWSDQAAAEEWKDFIVTLDQEYSQGLVDVVIEDI